MTIIEVFKSWKPFKRKGEKYYAMRGPNVHYITNQILADDCELESNKYEFLCDWEFGFTGSMPAKKDLHKFPIILGLARKKTKVTIEVIED